MSLSIRARLTLLYTAVLSLVLAGFAVAFYLIHARSRLARLDEELSRAGAVVARLMSVELDEEPDLGAAAGEALKDLAMPDRILAVFDGGGRLLSGRWAGLPEPAGAGPPGPAPATWQTPAGPFRVHWARQRERELVYQVGVAESLAPLRRELAALRQALLVSFVLSILLAGAGGWTIARGALRPVDLMAAQARRISGRTPGFQLASPNPDDELGLLAKAFNDLLTRLESVLALQRRFMADASHELRTPVSVARTAVEVTLGRRGRPEEEYRDCLEIVADQTRRLSRIVEDMLTLARADAAGLSLERRPLYLDELVAECVEEMKVLAAPRAVTLGWKGEGEVEVTADERLLRQMLNNLLHNAIRHTPRGGEVRVDLAAGRDGVEVTVTDSGTGVPPAEGERIFERFVRLDPSRGGGDGAGLGLPIARAIAEAHGGSLVLARSDSSGSAFRAWLPPGGVPSPSE